MSDAQYVNAYVDGRDVVLLHRKEGGALARTTVPAEYVTYLRYADVPEDMRRQFSSSNYVRSIRREKDWLRVGWKDGLIRDAMCFGKRGGPASPLVEKGIPTFEGDVHPVRRFLTDSGSRIQRPRRCYFDLETDSRVPFSRKEEMRILSWAVYSDEGLVAARCLPNFEDKAEHDLIAEFWEAVAAYDQLIAWNLDNFDRVVLEARTDQVGVRSVDFRNHLWLDHLVLFRRMNMHSAESGEEKQSMKLQSIATATLGRGKVDFDAAKTYDVWASGPEGRTRLLEYNVGDTELLPAIEAKTGYVDLFNTLADVCRVFPESRGLNPTIQMDGYMLRLGMERDLHFPTKRFQENTEQFKGAFVMEPRTSGIMRNVHVVDFAALYPSIILTWNMSPETKKLAPVNGPVPEGLCRAPLTGQGFLSGVGGVLPTALRELIKLRKAWNEKKSSLPPGTPEWHEADQKSTAYKVAANSFYGVVGSPFSRYFDKMIAESVTQNGVWLIKKTIAAAEERGMSVVYGDTDSVFVANATRTQFEEFVRWCNAELYPGLIRGVGCASNEIKLAYEKQFERIVFTGAKRYCGRYSHYKGKDATAGSKPEIKGLEFKRGDTAKLARELQVRVIDMLMDGQEQADVYRGVLGQALQHVLNDDLPPEEVTLSKSLTKPLKEYETKKKMDGTEAASLPHVQVAKTLKDRGQEVGEGTRIEYFVVDGAPGKPNTVKPAADYGEHEADRYYLWESLVYPPTQRLLRAAFPDVDWTAGYERIRPAKIRASRKKPVEGQLGFLAARPPEKAGPPKFDAPFQVLLRERMGKGMLVVLRDILRRHPGPRPVVVHTELESGVWVSMDLPDARASGEPAMAEEIERAKFLALAAYEAVEVMAHA